MTTIKTSTTSRRTVLTTAAAGAVGTLALTACGSEDDDSASAQDSAGNGAEGSGGSGEQPAGEPLAVLSDVPVGEATAVTMPDGEEAFVFRADESTVAAFSAICTHQGCAVQSQGVELYCPCHASYFDAATGEVLEGPAEDPLPAYAVRIEGDDIVTA